MMFKYKAKNKIKKELAEANQEIIELKKTHNNFKQAKLALISAAADWRKTFDSITDFVSLHDEDLKLIKVNKALADFVGMKPEELIGKYCYNILHGTEEPFPGCPHIEMMKSKEPVTKEIFDPKLGLHLMVSVSPFLDEDGTLIGSVHIAKNITERKRSEEALSQEKKFTDALFEALPGIVFAFDRSQRFFRWNRNLEQVLGYSQEELKKIYAFQLICPRDRQRHNQAVENVFATGKMQVIELSLLTKDGEEVPYHFTGIRKNIDSEVYQVGIGLDIIERKKSEKEKERLILQLREALSKVKTLSGLIPICSSCQRIRDDKGYWKLVADYISKYSEAKFSHGLCPECAKKLYPDVFNS